MLRQRSQCRERHQDSGSCDPCAGGPAWIAFARRVRAAAPLSHRARRAGPRRRAVAPRAGRGLAAPDRRAPADDQRVHPRRPRVGAGGGGRDQARRSPPVRRRADRDQGQPAGGRHAADDGQRPVRRLRPRPRRVPRPPAARGRLRDRRQDLDARDGDPARPPSRAASAPRATRGTSSAPRAARAAARRRRWPRGWFPWPTATTAAARSGSRPPAAGWSGSSLRAGGCRSDPTAGRASWSRDGVLTRTVAGHRRGARRAGRA